jgi:hypothetical protein
MGSKYSMVVESMDLTVSPATAIVTIIGRDGNEHSIGMQHFPWQSKLIWKIQTPYGPGAAWPDFPGESGHRSSLARWCKKVELDQSLIGQNAQHAGAMPRTVVSSAQTQEIEALKKQNARQSKMLELMAAQLGIQLDDEESSEE